MKLLRSTSLRLAALYTVVFALAVLVLGAVTVAATRTALKRELDARIQSEAMALTKEYQIEGLEGVVQAVRERDRTPGALDYGVETSAGKPIAGRLAGAVSRAGWSTLRVTEADGDADQVRVLTLSVGGGYRLLVGENIERISVLDGVVVRAFGLAFLGVIVLGAGSGFALSRDVHRRFGEMSAAAQAIIEGDLARRIPVRGSGDDLDALATTFNRMLDRISALMDSLRQVSNDIAHDLRTPLTRLRQRLEASLLTGRGEERETAIEAALGDLDAILDTFAALLRIAQIEGGARRAAFRQVDLGSISAAVVEAFAPSAEEERRSLGLAVKQPATVEGDPELLTQMLVNLVENGLRHTPPGSSVRVSVGRGPEGAFLSVRDDGPGVPVEAREHLFDRFVRLERSRSTPGSGLGLALVAAVARLHDASVELIDASPGLEVKVSFAAPAPWRHDAGPVQPS
ncbi:MAG: sensor histidine kinase [Phenylobacterium sp.]|nr:sensor histidine kinase [Phenylobacterium sp.]